MRSRIRYFFADLAHWISISPWRKLAAVAVVVAAIAAVGLVIGSSDEQAREPASFPSLAPEIVVPDVPEPEAVEELGFPAFATANTTRVAGPDPVATAAGVALAAHPSAGGVEGPAAVTLVDAGDWHSAIAAGSLVAEPVGAPILATADGEIPAITATALDALDPAGSPETGGAAVFALGAAAAPDGVEAVAIDGENPAEIAAELEDLRTSLAGEADHLLLASSDEPAYAMPAASWAARSGDPVLFVQRDSLPAPTRRVLERNTGVPTYVLGPPSVVSDAVLGEVREVVGDVSRVGAEDPVENAIEFARYAEGSFGWNINDPGHGIVIASVERPLDAGAAAPLSAGGTWGPLLLTDDAGSPPDALRAYLLDLKPGYRDDPTRAVYNHVWLIGDTAAISVDFQAQADDLAALVPVTSGRGGSGQADEGPADTQTTP